jgi:Na+/phosphate symporter
VTVSTDAFLLVGVVVLSAAILAMMLILMLTALIVDDWFEIKNEPRDSPARLVAQDELWTSVIGIISILMVMVLGVLWVIGAAVTERETVVISPLTFIIAGTLITQVFLADLQGVRRLLFRRRMAQLLGSQRRAAQRSA